jgi:hypothetical protein
MGTAPWRFVAESIRKFALSYGRIIRRYASHVLRNSSGSCAMFRTTRRASSLVSSLSGYFLRAGSAASNMPPSPACGSTSMRPRERRTSLPRRLSFPRAQYRALSLHYAPASKTKMRHLAFAVWCSSTSPRAHSRRTGYSPQHAENAAHRD